MNTASNNNNVDGLLKKPRFKNWTSEYRFALFSVACELLIVFWSAFHGMQRMPLDAVVGIAKLGAVLTGLMSIFIDRSPWPGIVLFWLSLSSLLIRLF